MTASELLKLIYQGLDGAGLVVTDLELLYASIVAMGFEKDRPTSAAVEDAIAGF